MIGQFLRSSELLYLPQIALAIFFAVYLAVAGHIFFGMRRSSNWRSLAHLPFEEGEPAEDRPENAGRGSNHE